MPITVKNVSYTYDPEKSGEAAVLKDISLHIEDGEFVAIMGHTGSGKSTLVQLMSGLLDPSMGEIDVDGEDIAAPGYDRSGLRKKIGVVFQYPEKQLFETTVYKDVAFGLKHSGLKPEEIRQRVEQALEAMGFDYGKIKDESPFGLSGGEKRRAAIAGVLAVQPKYLILDEPAAGLDPVLREQFKALLKSLNRQGVTVIMVSHNTDYVAETANRVILMEKGRIREDAPVREVFSAAGKMEEKGFGDCTLCRVKELVLQKTGQRGAKEEEEIRQLLGDTVRYREFLDAVAGRIRQKRGEKEESRAFCGEEGTGALERGGEAGEDAREEESGTYDTKVHKPRNPKRRFPGGHSLSGQYIAAESALHRMDGRVKFFAFLFLTAAVVAAKGVIFYGILAVLAVSLLWLTGLPLRKAAGYAVRLPWLFVTVFVMNALFFSTEAPIWHWWIFSLTAEGMGQGLRVISKIVLVTVFCNILMVTTPPGEITAAIRLMLRPLKLVRLPADDIAMILSVAMAFIPTLFEEVESIKLAQLARGARFESRSLTKRAAAILPLVVPVFLSAFKRADELAMAMESRGYRSETERKKEKNKRK